MLATWSLNFCNSVMLLCTSKANVGLRYGLERIGSLSNCNFLSEMIRFARHLPLKKVMG